jgi:L-cysteine:1D-myo-inositol 2-amino-2-deoxy-alpha-D-glucopyranoside ligase
MRLYDTAKRAVVPFEPNDHVLMYTCGITPYDATHLGHAATFIAYDVLQRRLIDRGHTVTCVRNVTDVDDPLFAKARELGVHYLDLAAGEEARFERDMVALNALPVASTPRASSAIPDIRGFIGMVLDRGYAYEAGGSVYFDVSKFESFGTVSNYTEAEMIEFAKQRGGHVDDPHKRNPLDFVLWHPSAPDEPSWDTMWGPGRPGWHIECSALALRELGTTIDLHGGGTDLIFPHHECERAQSEAATGRALRQALDAHRDGHKDGEKMSKSLGNLVFVDKLRTEWDPMAIRLAIIEHHYRTEWEWDDELMPRNAARLDAVARRPTVTGDVIDEVARARRRSRQPRCGRGRRSTPRAAGESTRAAAELLGVVARRDLPDLTTGRARTGRRHGSDHAAVPDGCRGVGAQSLSVAPGADPGAAGHRRAAPIATRLWTDRPRGLRAAPPRGSRDPVPQPHQLPRLGVPDAHPAAQHQLRRQGRVHGLVEDQVPVPGDGHDPDRPLRWRQVPGRARRRRSVLRAR